MKIVNTHQIIIVYDEEKPITFIAKLQETLIEIEKRSNIAEIHIDTFQYQGDIIQTAVIIERKNELAKK